MYCRTMAKIDPSSLLGEERLFLIINIKRSAPATAAAKMATTAPAMVALPEPPEDSEVAAADSAGPRTTGVVGAFCVVADEDVIDDDVLMSDDVDKDTVDVVAGPAWDVEEVVTLVVVSAVVVIEVELVAVAAIVAGAGVAVGTVVCTVAVVGACVVVVLAIVVGVVVACAVVVEVVSGVIVVISVGVVDV